MNLEFVEFSCAFLTLKIYLLDVSKRFMDKCFVTSTKPLSTKSAIAQQIDFEINKIFIIYKYFEKKNQKAIF